MSGQVGLACDVTVTILKPDLNPLPPAMCMEGSGFTDVKVLPAPGQYTITVNPEKWATSGLTLTLYDVPADVSGGLVIGGPLWPYRSGHRVRTAPSRSPRRRGSR